MDNSYRIYVVTISRCGSFICIIYRIIGIERDSAIISIQSPDNRDVVAKHFFHGGKHIFMAMNTIPFCFHLNESHGINISAYLKW